MGQIEIVKYLDGENGVTNKIKKAMYDVARQFVYIGFLLWEVQQYGYYKEHGFQNVYEYAAYELNLKRTTVKNLIGINEAFGSTNTKKLGNGRLTIQRTMSLQPAYEKFNYSQLTEMLSMSEPQRAKVTPDMSIRKIREIKKEKKPDSQTSDQEPEFPLEPEYETTPIEVYTESQTSDRQLEYTITLDRSDMEYIIDLLEDEIRLWDKGSPEHEKAKIMKLFFEYQIKNKKEEG